MQDLKIEMKDFLHLEKEERRRKSEIFIRKRKFRNKILVMYGII